MFEIEEILRESLVTIPVIKINRKLKQHNVVRMTKDKYTWV